jgi:hypothetical protein
MAINKNHEFEDLEGNKCAIVEKNIPEKRVLFLKNLLVHNGYTVVIIPAPPPKVAANPDAAVTEETPPVPELFNVGVTDLSFNPINAIFGRLLKTPKGYTVTQSYWNQQEEEMKNETPYYEHTELVR